jgi:integrase
MCCGGDGDCDQKHIAQRPPEARPPHAAMVLVWYRHGLRVSELVSLEWSQVDFNAANLHVRRLKSSTLRALRRLQREQDPKSAFVFTSERGAPFRRRPSAGRLMA